MRRAGIIACAAALLSAATSGALADPVEITAPGPLAELHGTFVPAGDAAPVVLVIPGSGPTDRDGNSPIGVSASTYRLIAEGLAERGIASVRIDKRGMFGSATAVADANAVTIADYATDVRSWISTIQKQTGVSCVWLLGHSEGALVALAAAKDPNGVCGVLVVAGPGRKLGDIMRQQLRANPANASILPQALYAIGMLEKGGAVDPADLPPALAGMFAPAVQPFLRDLFKLDPVAMMAEVTEPTLILQGESDLQITLEDAQQLVAARPDADLVLLPGVNHVLKAAPKDDMAVNFATYANPGLPLGPGVIDALAGFVLK
jgi:alpha-beta hydrolase superfamily lysophospholipase